MQQTSMQEQQERQNKTEKEKGGIHMFNTMKKRMTNEKGLTLIELLAVVVILAIVAAIAVPSIGNIIDNSRYKAAKSDAIMILDAANLYFTDTPSATTITIAALNTNGYLDNRGTFAADATGAVTKVSTGTGNTLSGTATITGGKTITFTNATVSAISSDERSAKAAFNGGNIAAVPAGGGS